MPKRGISASIGSFSHGFLKLPYRLHVRYKRIKNPFGTTYVLIHGLADTGELWKPLLEQLPRDANYVVFDLLGHGRSKRPDNHAFYSAYRQAINVRFTYATLGLTGPVVLIGHSFGSLVAAEFAHHYRRLTQQLILCSPPLYRDPDANKRLRIRQESILRELYRQILKSPKSVVRAYGLATKFKLLGFSQTEVTEDTFVGFEGTLRAGIISQTAGNHLAETTVPTTIIYGIADPLIIHSNLTKLAKINRHVTTTPLAGAHAVTAKTIRAIKNTLTR